MQFNSFTFVIFFVIVVGMHHLPLPWTVRKINLIFASALFYAAWNPAFLILIGFVAAANWIASIEIQKAQGHGRRKAILVCNLVANLGLLGFFKYSGFLAENFVFLCHAMGMAYQPSLPDIVLPVGISFYTFQALSASLDVYLGRSAPSRSFLDYTLSVTFFPQLLAGPITRPSFFASQCREPQRTTSHQFGWGMSLLVLGLFEKVVLADGILLPISERVFSSEIRPGFIAAWTGTLAFSGQIFCDFAGYSTCAIGIAMCLGFALPINFRFPYAALGFSDFWSRWHISLSSWLRDYLYIPLGGNRHGKLKTFRNLMITMLLGGLWHGAAWTFVVWGGLHGLCLAGEHLLKGWLGTWKIWSRRPARWGLILLTFMGVSLMWIPFRARTIQQVFFILSGLLGLSGPAPLTLSLSLLVKTLCVVGPLVGIHWALRDHSLEDVVSRCPWPVRSILLALMIIAIVTMQGDDRAFIYFQF